MKFIADAMLGSLAKRMRLLGIDVLYDPSWDDNQVLRCALEQDRIILTRDAALAARPLASNNLFIRSEDLDEQLDQIRSNFPDETPFPFTRCSVCNASLKSIAKKDVQDLVPQYVYGNYTDFLQCPQCNRIYWQGTHVKRMALP